MFIVLEGIDGAGTTTQAELLRKALEEEGREAITTAEPTGGPIGALIRQVLNRRVVAGISHGIGVPLAADVMSLLFTADRMDHADTLIRPSLEKNETIICDRYFYSTIAYQGVGGDMKWIERLNEKALRPDLVFYLKIEPKISLKRIESRQIKEIYEKLEFLEQVSKNYDKIFEREQNVVIIDASKPVEAIAETIKETVDNRFAEIGENKNAE